MSKNKIITEITSLSLSIDGKYYSYVECHDFTSESRKFAYFLVRREDYPNKLIAFNYKDERGTVILEKDIYDKIIEVLEGA